MDTGTFGYEATPSQQPTNFDTLVSGPGNSSLVGVYTHPDGVQEMVETFNQNQYQLQSELLRHGALAWATRGVYFGDQRNYLDTNIDDNFLADDSWGIDGNATTRRIRRTTPRPMHCARARSTSTMPRHGRRRTTSGSTSCSTAAAACSSPATGTDPLLAEFKKTDPATGKPYTSDFGWINHTWDHPNIDQGCATQNYIEAEIQQNTAWGSSAAGLNLTSTQLTRQSRWEPRIPAVVVTGEHSGLANLLPGNPGIIDPPSFDSATVSTTGGTLPAGSYTYAITDQFSATGGESSASTTVQQVPANGSVALTWDAVCHAFDYKIYREVTGSNAWTLVTTITGGHRHQRVRRPGRPRPTRPAAGHCRRATPIPERRARRRRPPPRRSTARSKAPTSRTRAWMRRSRQSGSRRSARIPPSHTRTPPTPRSPTGAPRPRSTPTARRSPSRSQALRPRRAIRPTSTTTSPPRPRRSTSTTPLPARVTRRRTARTARRQPA